MIKARIIILVLISTFVTPTSLSVYSDQSSPTNFAELNKEVDKMPNIILLIGDGLSPDQIRAASLIEYGGEFESVMDKEFPVQQLYTTDTLDGVRTDSDASGTALATGFLVNNGAIGMDHTESYYLKNILEYLQYDFGYSTGIVTTQVISHATPASFAAHHTDRKDLKIIQNQMMSKEIDILLGAGLDGPYWGPDRASAVNKGELHNYDVVVNLEELESKSNTANKLLGVFAGAEGDHIGFEFDRDINAAPSLYQMTDNALQFLQRKNDPYFIMVEGGLIDYSGHLNYNVENKTHFSMAEVIAFEKTVRLAYDFALADGNTIVVVASDHDTGGLILKDFSKLDDILPNPNNSREENMQIRFTRANQMEMEWTWNAHTQIPVKFFGFGSDFGNHNITKNNEVFWAMNKAVGSFPSVSREFVINTDNLDVTVNIHDLDKSADTFSVVIGYNNGSKVEFNFDLDFDSTNSYQVTVPLDTTQSYTAYVKVHDGETNDVISFDSQNQLINQKVVQRTTTSSDPSSSSLTSEMSDEGDSPIYQSFLDLFFILNIVLLIPRKLLKFKS